MFNRRYLRVKTMQALYEAFIAEDGNVANGEKNLIKAIENLKVLSVYQLAILPQLVRIAEDRIEDAKNKMLPTQEDLTPNLKFLNNLVIKKITENHYFKTIVKENKIALTEEMEILKSMFQRVLEWQVYKKYMRNSVNKFEEDRDFIIQFFDAIYFQNDAICSTIEEYNMHWINDFYDASSFTVKCIREIKEESEEYTPLPGFERDNDEYEDDINFVKTLFRTTLKESEEFEKVIIPRLQNWESERVAYIDMIILKMAMTEFIHCPSVPIKVTINEYIELSKDYSTPKSKIFINGMLDKMANELKSDGKIKKTGRGLIGN
jgi:transcription antitermination protein NusB